MTSKDPPLYMARRRLMGATEDCHRGTRTMPLWHSMRNVVERHKEVWPYQ